MHQQLKTIQFGQREHLVPITHTADSPLCAASLLKRHLADVPAGPDSPLFLVRRGPRLVPLTYPPLLKFLKRLIKGIGINPERAGYTACAGRVPHFFTSQASLLRTSGRRATGPHGANIPGQANVGRDKHGLEDYGRPSRRIQKPIIIQSTYY